MLDKLSLAGDTSKRPFRYPTIGMLDKLMTLPPCDVEAFRYPTIGMLDKLVDRSDRYAGVVPIPHHRNA